MMLPSVIQTVHCRSPGPRVTGLGSLRPRRKDAVPGSIAGCRISGLITFGPTRAYCGGSHAVLGAPGVCLSVLEAKTPLHTRPTVSKRSLSCFALASAPHPSSSAFVLQLRLSQMKLLLMNAKQRFHY